MWNNGLFNADPNNFSEITGSGTANTMAKFTGAQTIGDSSFLTENATGLQVGGTTATALVDIAASTTARASLRMRLGTAPTTPNAGDVYFAGGPGSDAFYMFGGNLILSKTATNSSIFNYSNTAQRTYTFPDASGTVLFGTGTANTIAKFSDANTIADSQITDDGTNITGSAASGLITWVGGSGGVLNYTSTDRAIYVGDNILAGSFNKYIQVQTASTTISHVTTIAISSKAVTLTQQVNTSGSPTAWLFTGGAHTTLTASTEAIDVNYNLARTVQFDTGALATQRAFLIQAPTYGFVLASTITNAATLALSGAPVAGTNATITNAYALWVQAGRAQFDGTINGLTLTANATGFSIAGGTTPKTLTMSNTLTFTGTDGSSVAFGAGGTVGYCGRNPQSGTTYTVVAADRGKVVGLTNAAARTVTLPAASSITSDGIVWLKDEAGTAGSANITVARTGADTIDGATSDLIDTNYEARGYYSDGVSAWFAL